MAKWRVIGVLATITVLFAASAVAQAPSGAFPLGWAAGDVTSSAAA